MTQKTLSLPEALKRAQALSRKPDGHAEAAAIYRAILKRVPDHPEARSELARLSDALASGLQAELDEIRALLNKARWPEAQSALEALLRASPRVPLAHNLLGIVHAQQGHRGKAIDAFARAVEIAPEFAEAHNNLATALRQAGKPDMALIPARQATSLAPTNPAFRTVLAQVLADLGRQAEAVEAYETALAASPGLLAAHEGLCRLHESAGDLAAYRGAIEQAEASMDAPHPAIRLHRAKLLSREGADDAAVEELQRIRPEALPPEMRATRSELLGSLYDRLGESTEAFEAFSEANAIAARTAVTGTGADNPYLATLEQRIADVAAQSGRPWPTSAGNGTPPPVFLVGFPCSDTGLVRSVLRAHPDVTVVEKQDLLRPVRQSLGATTALSDLAALTDDRIAAARAAYFTAFDAASKTPAAGIRIDGMSLNLGEAALIHRLFPTARFLFTQRHPCDCVLSAFMQHFRSNGATDNFLTLEGTARVYDQLMTLWTETVELLDLPVEEIRLDAALEDQRSAMEPALAALGVSWDASLPDQTAGAGPQVITDRWRRYQRQMQDVLPLLEPWIARWGYDA
ncbi:tetratricopeptide repeat-containing sulfotransferase family protein [Tropicimonas marinistellae]|uniref:tetratricopeptide repeat-containing sulfotransferase family protein n=1 Tax=Tropicimonas marinistellae TaxID=1739787 RepID=UPI00082CF8DC|nr:sulfotransferase [Tropicimonas marinistellae]